MPTSGLRLEAMATSWQLTVFEGGEVVIEGDEFERLPGPQTFEIYRSGDEAWVVDPTGTVTKVVDPAIEKLAGPWACWQLEEDVPDRAPARVQEIWAG